MEQKRIYYIDNLKGLLILLVVFAHAIERFPFPFRNSLFQLCYSFHMPAFIFLSGICFTPKEPKASLKRILLTGWQYILWQSIFLIYQSAIEGTPLLFQYKLPVWILWYLLSLFCWRCIASLLPLKSKIMYVYLGGSIVLALLAGCDETIGYMYSLSRTICFLPFFLIGAIIRNQYYDTFMQWMEHSIVEKHKWLYAILGFFCGIVPFFYPIQNRDIYCSVPYVTNGIPSIALRFVILLMAGIIIAALLVIIPKRNCVILSFLGQASLGILLAHGFLRIPAYHYQLFTQWYIVAGYIFLSLLFGSIPTLIKRFYHSQLEKKAKKTP